MSLDQLESMLPPGPCAEDAFIREAGFRISERPPHGPAIWTRNGKSFTHSQALAKSAKEKPDRDARRKLTEEATTTGKR